MSCTIIRSRRARVAASLGALCLMVGAQSFAVDSESGMVYDREYPFVDYFGKATGNDVARLQERIDRGEVKLKFSAPRGYLDSLLGALRIDPSSQTLVFSKTSLQAQAISPQTPRAIYFDMDTYVGWIPNTDVIEIATMDSLRGAVFYTLPNRSAEPPSFGRETLRCLACHDTFSLQGGGVPNFLFLSAYTREKGGARTDTVANLTTDATPLEDRWGGWYVTGELAGLTHLGNIPPATAQRASQPVPLRLGDLRNLDSMFDTTPYLTDKSDAVALLVFEHQVYLHNLIIHANYKARRLLAAQVAGATAPSLHWEQLPPPVQGRMQRLLEPLVRGLLLVDAAKLTVPVHGNSGFAKWFESQGPRDARGRSLRDLDLSTRVFRYPLSFLIYSEGFDELPVGARDYVYRRLAQILAGRDRSPAYSTISPSERTATFQILTATQPEFARIAARYGSPAPRRAPLTATRG